MNWFNILKIMTPRQFLEELSEKTGGKVKGHSSTSKDDFLLEHSNGFVKVTRKGRGEYFVNVNGQYVMSDFNLSTLISQVEDMVSGEMEKVAGPLTTTSHPNLFKPTFGGGKNAKDDKED